MYKKIKKQINKLFVPVKNKKGMEFVQVGILISIAIVLGVIFRTQITEFINNTFADLNN